MKLSIQEQKCFHQLLKPLVNQDKFRQMQDYIQHGRITTYRHCVDVAKVSFWLNRRLHLHAQEPSLVKGALLHDFYLYDWHKKDRGHRLHGFFHPERARRNAVRFFHISPREQQIIRTHMWPLTLWRIPACREAWIVCMADKLCSTTETLFKR